MQFTLAVFHECQYSNEILSNFVSKNVQEAKEINTYLGRFKYQEDTTILISPISQLPKYFGWLNDKSRTLPVHIVYLLQREESIHYPKTNSLFVALAQTEDLIIDLQYKLQIPQADLIRDSFEQAQVNSTKF